MSKIPTAEEFQKKYSIEYYDEGGYQGIEEKEVSKMLIKFAKLHVEAALKQFKIVFSEIDDPYPFEKNDKLTDIYPLIDIK